MALPEPPSRPSHTITKTDPDPSILTTESMIRENRWLRELLETRLNAIDKEITLIREVISDIPNMRHEALLNLERLHSERFNTVDNVVNEKFSGIEKVLEERAKQVLEKATDTRTAVDAAFKAQNDSAAKTEKALGDQIKQTAEPLLVRTGALETQINDTKTRVTALESRSSSSKESSTEGRAVLFSIIAAIVGGGGLIFGLVAMLRAGGA